MDKIIGRDTELAKLAKYSQSGKAEATLCALASPEYLAAPGEIGGFLLKRSTGYFKQGSEVDVPLTYADYYFLEALERLKH